MNTPFQHNAVRPIATEAEIEALFGKPQESSQNTPLILTPEQEDRLRHCATHQEAAQFLKECGYDFFAR